MSRISPLMRSLPSSAPPPTVACRSDEIERFLERGRSFIDAPRIAEILRRESRPDPVRIRDILAKSRALTRLDLAEAAALLHCTDADLWEEIYAAAAAVKEAVYGRRIVLFAPLYVANLCVNDCLYCAFRRENKAMERRALGRHEIRSEVRALIRAGHKRLVVVYGEHPSTGVGYMVDTIRTVYETRDGKGEIRRVNVNAPPLSIADLRRLAEVGIGTFQVFQETYHQPTYEKVHGRGSSKGDFLWRLYAQHRAQEAGIDDVAIGALFGLYDYRFEVLGLLQHAGELERRFSGVGPHTISFPRLEPAAGASLSTTSPHRVSDRQFKELVAVLRLAVPYTGLILTAREPAAVRRAVLPVGCTQIDAGSNITLGGYTGQRSDTAGQQFELGDHRSLDEAIGELASQGVITSFCTAGYRCGRTGETFMTLAKRGEVHRFCQPNAILTFQEYLEDYASVATRRVGEPLVASELARLSDPGLRARVEGLLERIRSGERDVYI